MTEDNTLNEILGERDDFQQRLVDDADKEQLYSERWPAKKGGRPKKRRQQEKLYPVDRSDKIKDKTVWKEIPNVSLDYKLYVSSNGDIKVALYGRKDLAGRPLVNIGQVWVPVDELVAAAFLPGQASTSDETELESIYKKKVLVHKDGNLMNNTAGNLIYMNPEKVGFSRKGTQRPYIVPEDVMTGRYPEMEKRSPYFKKNMDVSKELGEEFQEVMTPGMKLYIRSLVDERCAEILSDYLYDTLVGRQHFSLPFFKSGGSDVPPSEYANGLPGSLLYGDTMRLTNPNTGDVAGMFGAKTKTKRGVSSGDASMIDKIMEDDEYRNMHSKNMANDYLDPKLEYEILKGEQIPEWRDNVIDTYIVEGRRVLDKDYVIVRRDYPGKTNVVYRIQKKIWNQAAKILKSIQKGKPIDEAVNMGIIPIRDKDKFVKGYSYLRDERGVYVKPKILRNEDMMKTAADWFQNPYQSNDPTLGGRLKEYQVGEIEMMVVICETLYGQFLEVIKAIEKYDNDLEKSYQKRVEKNQRMTDADMKLLRQKAAKDPKQRIEMGLLSEKERKLLMDNIREIGTQTLLNMGIGRGSRNPGFGSSGNSVRVKAEFFDGNFKIYESMREAADDLGVDPSQISKCIHGKVKNSMIRGIRFVPIDVREDIAVLLSIINRFNMENECYAQRERHRIAMEKDMWKKEHPDSAILKCKDDKSIQRGRPAGSKNKAKTVENVELVPELVKKPEIGEDERTVGEIYDEYMETEALKKRLETKNRSVGTDGSEIPDDEDLDALLRDDI